MASSLASEASGSRRSAALASYPVENAGNESSSSLTSSLSETSRPQLVVTDESEINLSNKGLQHFPSQQIRGFQKLKKLDVSHNAIIELTESDLRFLVMRPAKTITHLNLSHNQLTSIPSQISLLVNLRDLNVQQNKLTNLPAEIGSCVHLHKLHLSNNLLEELPVEISQLSGIKKLSVTGNPLKDPPLNICNKGIKEITAYFNLRGSSLHYFDKNKSKPFLSRYGTQSTAMVHTPSTSSPSSSSTSLSLPSSSSPPPSPAAPSDSPDAERLPPPLRHRSHTIDSSTMTNATPTTYPMSARANSETPRQKASPRTITISSSSPSVPHGNKRGFLARFTSKKNVDATDDLELDNAETEEFTDKFLLGHFTQLDGYCQSFGFAQSWDGQSTGSEIALNGSHSNLLLSKETIKKFKSNRKTQQRAFLNWMQKFLRLPVFYNINWAEIFHKRMIFAQNILLSKQLTTFQRLVSYFIDGPAKELPTERLKKSYTRLAEDLIAFLETHYLDPDSCLIGLMPNESLIRSFYSFTESSMANASLVKFLKGSDQEYSREKLMNKILLWSQMQDLEAIGKQVIAFADLLRASDVMSLQKGDIVIAKLTEEENNRIVFARLASLVNNNNSAKVWYSPDEKKSVVVSICNIWPLSTETKTRLDDVRSMQKLVRDEVDVLYLTLKQNINDKVGFYLRTKGVDTVVLDKAFVSKPSLADFKTMKNTQIQLKEIFEQPSVDLLTAIEHYASTEIEKFLETIDEKTIFLPVKNETLSQLKDWPISLLTKNRIQHYIGICDSALDQLQIESKEIMDGSRKKQLSTWWLELIKKKVEQFLEEKNFDFTAVCDDYIDVPPINFESVRANLNLIREILNTDNDIHNVRENLILPLTTQIYERIDEYLRSSMVLLADYLGITTNVHLDSTPIQSEWIKMQALLREKSGKPKWVDTMEMDIMYLVEMKAVEKNQENQFKSETNGVGLTSHKIEMSHVVPISGLILSRFFRIENELKTVLDVWLSQDKVNATLLESSQRRHSQLST